MWEPRKAAASLEAKGIVKAPTRATLVLDSLPFGADNTETQVLHHMEVDHLAKEFAEMGDVPIPDAPTATCCL